MSKTHLHTTDKPYIKFWKFHELSYPEIKQGRVKRDYMTNTYNSHAYHCQPMSNANVMGWEFILPQDVVVIWDGITDSSPDHIKVIDGQYIDNYKLVTTDQGNGMLQFMLNVAIETDANHFCRITGAPNYFVDGAKPMDVIIRTDYYNFNQMFFSWKIDKANEKIVFKKGMPIAFLVNYPISLLESTELSINSVKDNPTIIEKQKKYYSMQDNIHDSLGDWEWTHFYRDGKVPDHPEGLFLKLKPSLKDIS